MQSTQQMSCKSRQTTLFTFLAGKNTYKKYDHRRPKNVAINFVHCKRRRQRIVYIYSIHKVGNLISPDEHMTFVKHKIHRLWN